MIAHHNPRIALAITPRDSQFHYPTTNFVIFDHTTVQVETVAAEITVTQPREITLYERVFDLLLATAVTSESARSLIEAAINHYRPEKR
ncbi:Scr1 family TA system antitoxin-like transcriptional regulator [Nocardia sp. BMG51109]|uniref:Scr1 family TA system antitoxin-like transcriptional regulator n=1 Tax=Nocardia sp. BMG51109 TaxID=1056816 RepID=UPI000464A790|nr:Scr1 family TA system antitoxin-like transcriptional regulator [Nocardia sp. BMG51109]